METSSPGGGRHAGEPGPPQELVVDRLPRAGLRGLDGGDRSFGVKGTPDERGREALDRLADWTVKWLAAEVRPGAGKAPGPG